MTSKPVKISALKNQLSHYLRQVRRGDTILVADRENIIARIEPASDADLASDDDAHRLEHLERGGTIRRAEAALPRGWRTRPKVRADVVRALVDERDDRGGGRNDQLPK